MITEFINEYAFLSNFYLAKITTPDLVVWKSAEHLFQAYKTLDTYERSCINAASTPGMAKKLGRSCTLRSNWELIKYDVMTYVVRLKFYQNPSLMSLLISTGNIPLQEGNMWHDNTWGICLCKTCKGLGKNYLGNILMKLRYEFSFYSEFTK